MRVQLPEAARTALLELALRERRAPASQAEYLIIQELHRRGLVSSDGLERVGDRELQDLVRSQPPAWADRRCCWEPVFYVRAEDARGGRGARP